MQYIKRLIYMRQHFIKCISAAVCVAACIQFSLIEIARKRRPMERKEELPGRSLANVDDNDDVPGTFIIICCINICRQFVV